MMSFSMLSFRKSGFPIMTRFISPIASMPDLWDPNLIFYLMSSFLRIFLSWIFFTSSFIAYISLYRSAILFSRSSSFCLLFFSFSRTWLVPGVKNNPPIGFVLI